MSARSPNPSWLTRFAKMCGCGVVLVGAIGCRDDHAAAPGVGARSEARPNAAAGSSASRPGVPLAGDAGGFVEHQLALRVAQFGGAMIAAGPIARGSIAQGAAASHDLEMIANHCYRILAVGGVEVNDIDLALFGPDGAELDSDTGGGDYPALGTVRPICPPSPGRYRIEVRMRSGQGDYAVVAVRTP